MHPVNRQSCRPNFQNKLCRYMPILYWPNIDTLKSKPYVREQHSFRPIVPLQDWSQSLSYLHRPYNICNDPAIITTFLWVDCHTHGPHKSMHLDSCSTIGLLNEGMQYGPQCNSLPWVTSHLHYTHEVSDIVHNLVKQ